MHVPWFSFGAVTLLATLALTQLRALNTLPDVASAPQPVIAVSEADARSGKHAAPPIAPALSPVMPPHSPAAVPGPFVQPQAVIPSTTLIIPVAGVVRSQLTDTWGAARAQGRTHEGIDILAPQGTPVIAATSGRIVKFFDSERGGVTIYEFDTNERFVYYYAHLLARAPGLAEGYQVRQGQAIGYVGMTGNAPVPHLHFEVERLGPEHHWWRAESINPFPLLMTGQPPSA
jgi:murein DD-endopeptidase MepM/ murein hydrolase activator NlpD